MTRITTLIICLFFLHGLSAQDNQFHINGKISTDFNGKQVKLFITYENGRKTIDSTIIDKGSFNFTGTENPNELSRLFVEDINDKELTVFLEKGKILVTIGKESYDYSVGGTPLNDLYQSYCDSNAFYSSKVTEMYEKGDGGQTTGNNTGMTITKGGNLEKIYAKWGGFLVDFKKKNISNPVGKVLFKNNLKGSMPEFIWGHGTDSAFQVVYNLADEKLKSDPTVLKYIKQKEADAKKKALQTKLIGKKYLDIPLVSTNEKKDKLSSYIGKSDLILIDYWASWCIPCVGAMPKLKEIYDKYKDKGLKVIGISVDDNKQSWSKMLSTIDAPWSQFMIDGLSKELSIQLYDSYGLRGIPYCVLINKNGRIVHIGRFPTDSEFETLLTK
jgi:thiol-disulfide isomerase/thioredoxin